MKIDSISESLKCFILNAHTELVRTVAISDRWVATASDDGSLRLWDLDEEDPSAKSIMLYDNIKRTNVISISPDSHWLAIGSDPYGIPSEIDGALRLWDLTGKDIITKPIVLKQHDQPVISMAFTYDGSSLITGSADSTARVWKLNPSPSPESRALVGHEGLDYEMRRVEK